MKITDDMLTEWFPIDVKPVHEGVYPTLWRGKFGFAHYGSGGWGHSYTDFEIACRLSSGPDYPSDYQDKQFRGLKEKHHG
ncbi:hypothetical protein [Burkholderia cenocepacia]|uniref:hypothetical protein n=1 Tax=Burkholderia cenocepacia TaxID=95486 RepID=UPI001B90A335|nr:hypothetical protein [Burkholderia cenocepacia]MBR7905927.1 hypothetical protein [Burkholderia cenocepacia]MBR8424013.1 hypothetical protein [Burkholderia cenocepacia]